MFFTLINSIFTDLLNVIIIQQNLSITGIEGRENTYYYTDRAQSRHHSALKLSYAKLMLCYVKIV
jgi:hypothetical protein